MLVTVNIAMFSLLTRLQQTHPASVEDLRGMSFVELTKHFRGLAVSKGPQFAFDVLRQAALPENTDLHLLGHIIGDELYKQQGAAGIHICTQDFRNACSHSIVVGLYLESGEESLAQIAEICNDAPGGEGAYTMCYHGLGHGILAAVDYDLEHAIGMCEKTATSARAGQEAAECVGGAIMEIISGGDHNRRAWEDATRVYLNHQDPLYPCTASFIPDTSRRMCLFYLTPYLLTEAGADLASPTEDDFSAAFSFCDRLPREDTTGRYACFGGFGKEFIVLVQGRDIRKIEELTDDQLGIVVKWCGLAGDATGVYACIIDALNSLYWGGENDVDVAVRFCGQAPDDMKQQCYRHIVGAVEYYHAKDPEAVAEVCDTYLEELSDACN